MARLGTIRYRVSSENDTSISSPKSIDAQEIENMIQQYKNQNSTLQWSVIHETYSVPFARFENAVSYANGLASKEGDWVKVIDVENGIIKMVKSQPVSWTDDFTDERSWLTRRHRVLD